MPDGRWLGAGLAAGALAVVLGGTVGRSANHLPTPDIELPRPKQQDPPRKPAEWASFAFSLLIVAVLTGLVIGQAVTESRKPAYIEVQARPVESREAGGLWYVPLEITNPGGIAAQEVRVQVALIMPDGARESTTIRFSPLAPGASMSATVGYRGDPRCGSIVVETVSFITP